MNEKIMVAGHLCLDITPRFPACEKLDISRVFSPGQLTNVEDMVLSTGGAVSNTGLALAKLGFDVVLSSRVGGDELGNIIRRLVGPERAVGLRTVCDQGSSYTIVLAPPGVDRFFLHYPATNDTFGADDIDYELAGECKLFHFGYPPLMKNMYENDGAELIEILRRVKGLGVTTSLDMAMPDPSSGSGQVDWRRILERVSPYVDIFLPSIEEIAFMTDRDLFEKRKARAGGSDTVGTYESKDFAEISANLLSLGVKIVVIKCGVRGLYLRTATKERVAATGSACPEDAAGWAGREVWAASFKAENFASALGAGDSTIAGFLCGLIRGFSPEDALQTANIVGWQNVQALDAVSGITDFENTIRLLEAKDRARNPAGLDLEHWRYSTNKQVYYGPQDGK